MVGDPPRSALAGLLHGRKVIGEGAQVEIGTQAMRTHRRILGRHLRPSTVAHLPVLMAGGRVSGALVAAREDALHIFGGPSMIHERFAEVEHWARNIANWTNEGHK